MVTHFTVATPSFIEKRRYRALAEEHAAAHWWFTSHGYEPKRDVLEDLLELYMHVAEMPKFEASKGRRFIFWQPHVSAFGEDRFWTMRRVRLTTLTPPVFALLLLL